MREIQWEYADEALSNAGIAVRTAWSSSSAAKELEVAAERPRGESFSAEIPVDPRGHAGVQTDPGLVARANFRMAEDSLSR